jgi:hypothetical protein
MKSNTSGNYIIAIEGTSEEIQFEKVNERLKTQNIKLIGQRVDLRAGIYQAMVNDKEICKLIIDAAEYYNSVQDPKTWEAQFKKATKNTHEKNNKRPRKK